MKNPLLPLCNYLLLTSLSDAIQIKTWCNANITVDITSFFVLFVFIFRLAQEAFGII